MSSGVFVPPERSSKQELTTHKLFLLEGKANVPTTVVVLRQEMGQRKTRMDARKPTGEQAYRGNQVQIAKTYR